MVTAMINNKCRLAAWAKGDHLFKSVTVSINLIDIRAVLSDQLGLSYRIDKNDCLDGIYIVSILCRD